MPARIVMPKLAPTMEKGTITKWCVKENDTVKKGDVIAEIMTDKATYQLESPEDGVVYKLLYEANQEVPIDTLIAIILLEDETPEDGEKLIEGKGEAVVSGAENNAAKTTESEKQEHVEPGGKKGKIKATPAARRLAREENIDLAKINGSGPNGRIVKKDVNNYLQLKEQEAKAAEIGFGREIGREQLNLVQGEGEEERIPFTGIREIKARNLEAAKENVVPVTSVTEVNMTELMALHKNIRGEWEEQYGIRVTMNAFLIRALALSLRENLELNSTLDEANKEIVLKKDINIGVAMHINDNLIVPVIRYADKRSVLELASSVAAFIEKAKENKLTHEEMSGGTFTFTNVGPFGVQFSTPVIVYPQVGILGIGQINEKPVFNENDEVIKGLFSYISLTYDHRVVDGVPAAQFRQNIKTLIESPYRLLQ